MISVDTHSAEVARRCIEAGANVINDTSGLYDPDMAAILADSAATLVLTHSLAPPRSEPPRPHYGDVTAEVAAFLRDRIERAVTAGVPLERLIVDPGHDLNKNTRHSLELTRRLGEIIAIGLPTLVAVSNKDFIGETLGSRTGQTSEWFARRGGHLHHQGGEDREDARRPGRGCRRAHDGSGPRLSTTGLRTP